MTDQRKKCLNCRMSIPEDASVCFRCHRSQNRLLARVESAQSIVGLISVLSLLLAMGVLAFSWQQFREAQKQRISANEALRQVLAVKEEAEQARDEARNAVENLRTNIKLLLEMEHSSHGLLLTSSDPVRAEKARQKLEEFAVTSEKERKKWLESFK